MEESYCKVDDLAIGLTEMMYLKRPYLGRQGLHTSSSICTIEAGAHIKVYSYYEIDRTKLSPKTPDQLKLIRVVMVTEKSNINVSLRFPSIASLRAHFMDGNCTEGKKLPRLDQKYVMGSELAGEVLYRRISPHEFLEKRNQWRFWVFRSMEPEKVSSPACSIGVSNVVPKKGSCLSEIKCTGMARWGQPSQVRYLCWHLEENNEQEVTSNVKGAEEEKGKEEFDVDDEEEKEEFDGEEEEEEEEVVGEETVKTDKSQETKKNLKRKPNLRPKREKSEKKNQIVVYKQQKNKAIKNSIDRWSVERYKFYEENMLKILKEKGVVFGKPILREALRSEAIGNTGLLDHLLKHMAEKVVPGGKDRIRRPHNAYGATEHWLESADLINIRKEARVQDHYWTPQPGWKLGDNPTQYPIYAEEINQLKEEEAKIKRDMQELVSKRQEDDLAIVATPNSCVTSQTLEPDNLLLPLKEMYLDLMNRKAKIEEQLMEISQSLMGMKIQCRAIPPLQCVMGLEPAGEVLYRRISPHDFSKKRNLWRFWVFGSMEPEKVSSPACSIGVSNVVPKKGWCWSEIKCTGMVKWGQRSQVRCLCWHVEEKNEQEVTSNVKDAEEEKGKEEFNVDDEEEKEEFDSEEEEEEEVEVVGEETMKADKSQETRKNLKRKPNLRPKREKSEKKNQIVVYKQHKNKAIKNSIDRWSVERYKFYEENMLKILKEKGVLFGKPILRQALRSEAIGNTGLLDHLLKHMAEKVVPGGKDRIRRPHNAYGAMEYWLESADLINIRKEARVQDHYWTSLPGWKLGDNPTQYPICAKQIKHLKEEEAKIKRDMQELVSKRKEDDLAIVATPNSCVTNQNLEPDNLLLPLKVFPKRSQHNLRCCTTRALLDYIASPEDVHHFECGSEIVIGTIGSGIWEDCPTFESKMKIVETQVFCSEPWNTKECDTDDEMTLSVRDFFGHGTECATIAAGIPIHDASIFGLRSGVARGTAPNASLAVYKVKWQDKLGGSFIIDDDVIAAFIAAVQSKVSVILAPLGESDQASLLLNALSIGSCHAMLNGILTCTCASNDGPKGQVVNNAPWQLTVGACNTRRTIITRVRLGNDELIEGASLNRDEDSELHPLVSYTLGSQAPNSRLFEGKIVLCNDWNEYQLAESDGARGLIVQLDSLEEPYVEIYKKPTVWVSSTTCEKVKAYIKSGNNPSAAILRSIEVDNPKFPAVGEFSSRGPNVLVPDVLKPDLCAPGVDILTATIRDESLDYFTIGSGTSYACSFAAGIAANVISKFKKKGMTLSPSGVKSAIITSVDRISSDYGASIFEWGAGAINPMRALDPGLIYDCKPEDFLRFLLGHYKRCTADRLKEIIGHNLEVSKKDWIKANDLNLPTLSAKVSQKKSMCTFKRIVTNVGVPSSKYRVSFENPDFLKISVIPDVLEFQDVGEQISFTVQVNVTWNEWSSDMASSYLVWKDDHSHVVRSPIVIRKEKKRRGKKGKEKKRKRNIN